MIRLYFYVEGQTEQEYVARWDEAEKQRQNPRERVLTLEAAFATDVGDPRFIPHIQLYEFETILLCNPAHFGLVYEHCDGGIAGLQCAVEEATSPELVNDGQTTAPSKWIISLFPQYRSQKTTIGVELAECVGLNATRSLCPHFDRWLKSLESLGPPLAGGGVS